MLSHNLGHVDSETRSLGQVLKNLVHSLESTILIKLHETVSKYAQGEL